MADRVRQFPNTLESFEAAFGAGLWDAPKGEMVICITAGGNEYLSVGHSRCGYTPGLKEGYHLWLQFPDGGSYMTSEVQSIDWETGSFRTVQSTYSFHFVKR